LWRRTARLRYPRIPYQASTPRKHLNSKADTALLKGANVASVTNSGLRTIRYFTYTRITFYVVKHVSLSSSPEVLESRSNIQTHHQVNTVSNQYGNSRWVSLAIQLYSTYPPSSASSSLASEQPTCSTHVSATPSTASLIHRQMHLNGPIWRTSWYCMVLRTCSLEQLSSHRRGLALGRAQG
jgi:hypothetical protein